MQFQKREKTAILKTWAAISIAFAIFMTTNFSSILSWQFLVNVVLAAVTAGLGVIIHEMAHKYVATKYNAYAEYESNDKMLLATIAIAFFGVIFAAPGAVKIIGHLGKKERGLISLAGPLSNLIFGLIFLGLFFIPLPALKLVAAYGLIINSWLALFNMIPALSFDGAKIWDYNKAVYLVMVSLIIILFIAQVPLGLF